MSNKPASAAAAAAAASSASVSVGARRRADDHDDGEQRPAKFAKNRVSVFDNAGLKKTLPGLVAVTNARKELASAAQLHKANIDALMAAVHVVVASGGAESKAAKALEDAKHGAAAAAAAVAVPRSAAAAAGAGAAEAETSDDDDEDKVYETYVTFCLGPKYDDPSQHSPKHPKHQLVVPFYIRTKCATFVHHADMALDATRSMFARILGVSDARLSKADPARLLETVCALALELTDVVTEIHENRRARGGDVFKAWNYWWSEYGTTYLAQREYGVLALVLAGVPIGVDWSKCVPRVSPVGLVPKLRVACDTWTARSGYIGAPAALTSALLARLIRLSTSAAAASVVVPRLA